MLNSITHIDFDGYGLASTIAHLMTFERDRFDQLESVLKSISPGVKRIRVRRIQTTRKSIKPHSSGSLTNEKVLADEIVLDMRSGDALPAQAISEGTLIVLGLLTVLVGPDRPNLVLIDELSQDEVWVVA
jgi:predicted ATPase